MMREQDVIYSSTSHNFYPFNTPTIPGMLRVIIDGNRCVLEDYKLNSSHEMFTNNSPYNGYVAFRKTEIPKAWWGNYDAVGLIHLDIHGGFTYCNIEGATGQDVILREYRKRINEINDRSKAGEDYDLYFKAWTTTRKFMVEELCKDDKGWVVFGFDCRHYGDEQNPKLKDPDYIMHMVKNMEIQLRVFAGLYDWYIAIDRMKVSNSEKDILRNVIIQDVLMSRKRFTKVHKTT